MQRPIAYKHITGPYVVFCWATTPGLLPGHIVVCCRRCVVGVDVIPIPARKAIFGVHKRNSEIVGCPRMPVAFRLALRFLVTIVQGQVTN